MLYLKCEWKSAKYMVTDIKKNFTLGLEFILNLKFQIRPSIFFRIQNVASPTVNMNCSQVQVVEISVSDAETRKLFRKSVLAQKCVSMAVSARAAGESGCAGSIGARIVGRKTDNKYPCCHEGTSVTDVVVCWGDSKVYTISLAEDSCKPLLFIKRILIWFEITFLKF